MVGVSNSGKSTLLRSLKTEEARARAAQPGRQPPFVVFVDGLDGVAATEASFYELLLRRLIETAREYGGSDQDIAPSQELHNAMLHASSALACRAYFAQAIQRVTYTPDLDAVIVLDNFDDLFCELPPWPLRHLRALRDQYGPQLCFVTATSHSLDHLRSDEESYEFIEMFQVYTHVLPALSREDSLALARYVEGTLCAELKPDARDIAHSLSGGHPGLLDRIVRASVGYDLPEHISDAEAVDWLLTKPHIEAECERLWHGLSRDERAGLQALLDGGAENDPAMLQSLVTRGILYETHETPYAVASPVFEHVALRHATLVPDNAGLSCDDSTGQIWVGRREITLELSDTQRRLVRYLYQRRNQVCTQQEIADVVWDTMEGVSPGAIYELVKRVRQKIEIDWHQPRLLVTVPGEGYRLESDT